MYHAHMKQTPLLSPLRIGFGILCLFVVLVALIPPASPESWLLIIVLDLLGLVIMLAFNALVGKHRNTPHT